MPPPLPPVSPELPAETDPAAPGIESGRLVEARLDGVSLDEAGLARASLMDVLVEDGSWANVDGRELSLRRVEFRRVRLTGASFPDARLEDVAFVDCRLDLASFRFARLTRVAFADCRLEEADFHEAKLVSVAFTDSNLTGANLSRATFERSELRGCELAGLSGAERLRGVRMPGPTSSQRPRCWPPRSGSRSWTETRVTPRSARGPSGPRAARRATAPRARRRRPR